MIDLNKMAVLRIDDYGVVPLPPNPGNYAAEFVKEFRQDLKPLEITQPEGPSFSVDGYAVAWQKWRLRVGFTPREGLVLHDIGYEDRGRVRPVLYRASLSDMVVPYGEPGGDHYRKNAFDAGEYGIGSLTNSLTLGCDCLGEIYYFDAHLNTGGGAAFTIPNAVCMHEEDYGILWKHTDWRTGHAEVRRSRRLVVSSVATVGNYEYGFFWYFYQDGTVQMEIKLTGIINTAGIEEDVNPKYGTLVAPGLNAHIHQHFFNFRLDLDVDGEANVVHEINTVAEPPGPDNPHANAFYAEATPLKTELEAQRVVGPHEGALLGGNQPVGQECPGPSRGLQADARGERPALCPPKRQHHAARRVHGQAPVGYPLRGGRNFRHRALSQPAPRRGRAARLHQERPQRGRIRTWSCGTPWGTTTSRARRTGPFRPPPTAGSA